MASNPEEEGAALAALSLFEQLFNMLILTSTLRSEQIHAVIAASSVHLMGARDKEGRTERQAALAEHALLQVERLGDRIASIFPRPESML